MLILRGLALFLVFFFSLVQGTWLSAAEINPEPNSKNPKSRIFSQIAAGASTVKTLSSDFSQERHLSMLKEPLISTGKFAYEKPDHIYWEIEKPSPMGFVLQGDKGMRWGGNSKVPEPLEINQEPMIKAIVEQVLAWTRADFSWLEKRYRISLLDETSHSLKLIPLSFQEKRFLTHIAISFSEDWTTVRSVELHEKGGDFTRLRFFNTLINPSLSSDLFRK